MQQPVPMVLDSLGRTPFSKGKTPPAAGALTKENTYAIKGLPLFS